jgi:hypothetical protein
VGCEYYSPNNPRKLVHSSYWPANTQVVAGTAVKAYVIDDPDVVWEIQVSTATNNLNDARFSAAPGGGVAGPATAAYAGQNFAHGIGAGGANILNPAGGSTITGLSGMYLNMIGTAGTDRTNVGLPFKVLGFSKNVSNDPIFENAAPPAIPNGYSVVRPFMNVMGTINNHVYRAGSVGITPA